jgi:opacity protein-like surface antigen
LIPLRCDRRISRPFGLLRPGTAFPGGDGTFNGNVLNPNPGGFNPGTNEYTADIESWVGLANGYVDLGKWWCVTPYVGAGLRGVSDRGRPLWCT